MIEAQPSQTAFLTAVHRAWHHHMAPEPKVLNDDLALNLSGLKSLDEAEAYVNTIIQNFTALSDAETASTFVQHIEASVCMRSRVVEEQLLLARERNIQQLVVLGAGLDSTAYRRKDLTEGLEVIEIDHPSTQSWKRECLANANIDIPDNVKFVAFDFENQTLAQAMEEGGIDINLMTFFTWLGVQMYLTDDAVKSTFSVVGKFPAGSELIMDFISPSYVDNADIAQDSVAQLSEVVSQMGEPILSKYYESELEERLSDAGFSAVDFFSARLLKDRYLGGGSDAYQIPDEATYLLSAAV